MLDAIKTMQDVLFHVKQALMSNLKVERTDPLSESCRSSSFAFGNTCAASGAMYVP
jgi:hypothetical protein